MITCQINMPKNVIPKLKVTSVRTFLVLQTAMIDKEKMLIV